MMNKLKIGLVLILYCATASAYVDPGSSLLLLQGLFALVGGVVVFVKNPLASIKSLYGKWSAKPKHGQGQKPAAPWASGDGTRQQRPFGTSGKAPDDA